MAFRYQGYPGVEIIPSFSAASYLVLGLYKGIPRVWNMSGSLALQIKTTPNYNYIILSLLQVSPGVTVVCQFYRSSCKH